MVSQLYNSHWQLQMTLFNDREQVGVVVCAACSRLLRTDEEEAIASTCVI